MIVVTGAAGFIGSCLVAKLNEQGIDDLILVDRFNHPLKDKNLENKKYASFYNKADFIHLIEEDRLSKDIDAILHMGACSSTTIEDVD